MEIIFYSTHCPKCKILETKMKNKNINYTEDNDVNSMLAKDIKSAPYLEIDGQLYDFKKAVEWVNNK